MSLLHSANIYSIINSSLSYIIAITNANLCGDRDNPIKGNVKVSEADGIISAGYVVVNAVTEAWLTTT